MNLKTNWDSDPLLLGDPRLIGKKVSLADCDLFVKCNGFTFAKTHHFLKNCFSSNVVNKR